MTIAYSYLEGVRVIFFLFDIVFFLAYTFAINFNRSIYHYSELSLSHDRQSPRVGFGLGCSI